MSILLFGLSSVITNFFVLCSHVSMCYLSHFFCLQQPSCFFIFIFLRQFKQIIKKSFVNSILFFFLLNLNMILGFLHHA
ncbi:hypothetical protein L9F63_020084, partial [Diploptera punctata]